MVSRPDLPAVIGSVRPHEWAYSRSPMILYWELTLACKLVCRHCRAKAMRRALPGELTTAQAVSVLDDITGFGAPMPHLVLTGGDPLERADLDEIMSAARARRIGVSLAPSVTPLLTKDRLRELRDAGMHAISLSLDGSCAEIHDGIRRVPGTFDQTMEAFAWCEELGIPVQVNTLVTADTAPDLINSYHLLETKKITRWTLFFLIHTGRGVMLNEVSPEQSEELLSSLWELNKTSSFPISTTEAIHYRRVAAEEMRSRGMSEAEMLASHAAHAWGIRDGNGIAFISHIGELTPSGFMPEVLGNVTQESIVDLYQSHPLMQALRDPSTFHGKCGVCEYNQWCGGARSRAYAASGDPLGEDPLCTYVPGTDVRNGLMPVTVG